MNVMGSKRLVLASAVGGAALIGAGLFAGGAFVSAQEVTPTPGAEQQQTAPSDGTTTPKSKEDCERDGAGGTGTGTPGTSSTRSDNSRYF